MNFIWVVDDIKGFQKFRCGTGIVLLLKNYFVLYVQNKDEIR